VRQGENYDTSTHTDEQKIKQVYDYSDAKGYKVTTSKKYMITDTKENKEFESEQKMTHVQQGMCSDSKEYKYSETK